jgi:hypothetical protein
MACTSVNDPEFERSVSLRDAYRIMERFVEDYLSRGDTEVVLFLTYLGLTPKGETCDPAAADDFLDAAKAILGSHEEAEGRGTAE